METHRKNRRLDRYRYPRGGRSVGFAGGGPEGGLVIVDTWRDDVFGVERGECGTCGITLQKHILSP